MSDRVDPSVPLPLAPNGLNHEFPDWIRRDESKISVFDVIKYVCGLERSSHARDTWQHLLREDLNKEIVEFVDYWQISGKGKKTPVVDGTGLNRLLFILKGKKAIEFRQGAADILTRVFAGDQTLHADIDAIHASDHPARLFYEHGLQVKERSDIRKRCIEAHKEDMDAIQKVSRPAAFEINCRLTNHAINTGATGYDSTEELKIARGWDQTTPMTGRDFMTPIELSTTISGHLYHAQQVSKGIALLTANDDTRKRARLSALAWV